MARGAVRRFVHGRYGMDRLGVLLLLLCLVLIALGLRVDRWFLAAAPLPAAWALFRALSRQYDERRAEDVRFCRMLSPAHGLHRLRGRLFRDRNYRYFRCAGCGRCLRAPKGEEITVCRCCGARIQRKS